MFPASNNVKLGERKAQRAIRTKSGCFTCRIRRKVLCCGVFFALVPLLTIRNATNVETNKEVATHVSVYGSNVWVSGTSALNGFIADGLRSRIKTFLTLPGAIKRKTSGAAHRRSASTYLPLSEGSTMWSSDDSTTSNSTPAPTDPSRSLQQQHSDQLESTTDFPSHLLLMVWSRPNLHHG
ncbi:hypothetical protein R3P38DRAFT_3212977 [Favolaschia claudopus]|uniref:Uncharacterized protein n=1 Tax=Favolaschia claudopus TaxID=2862362 RepID=A0AAW0ADE2_9AGAR